MAGDHVRLFLKFNHYNYNIFFIYSIVSSVIIFQWNGMASVYRILLFEEFECKSNLRRLYKKVYVPEEWLHLHKFLQASTEKHRVYYFHEIVKLKKCESKIWI